MIGFENRLTRKKSHETKASQANQMKKKLKGKGLADYIEAHRQDFQGDGDTLCVEAGYGKYSQSGEPICDFKPFIQELSTAVDLESPYSHDLPPNT